MSRYENGRVCEVWARCGGKKVTTELLDISILELVLSRNRTWLRKRGSREQKEHRLCACSRTPISNKSSRRAGPSTRRRGNGTGLATTVNSPELCSLSYSVRALAPCLLAGSLVL